MAAVTIADKIFVQFLLDHNVRSKDLRGAAVCVASEMAIKREGERWWSLERLSEVPGLAKDWSYGDAYLLNRYGRDLNREAVNTLRQVISTARDEEVRALETVLGRSREANAILVGQTAEDRLSVLLDLAAKIKSGKVVPALEHKRLFFFDPEALLAIKSGQGLEAEIIKILNEAMQAGNIILALDNFASFIEATKKENVNLISLLDPYLASARLQFIALATVAEYHQQIEIVPALLNRLEKVSVNSVDRTRLNQIAMQTASRLEKRSHVFFTYPGLMELASASEQYFANEPALDKTIDLLVEIISWAEANEQLAITRDTALQFISQKTKIPLGEASSDERQRLLNVENILHERIVGQNLAIDALGKALRRARTGLRNPKRPIGSFLFLGPTGVGKTETAKALGAFFFNDESAMHRLDMSEYQAGDALAKLIGTFTDKKPGVLATMIRERPYGVLLLDEFEKTTPEVLNLFLQILDEGFFSDMNGERVNARNLLIVATSNAGSDLIWQLVKNGVPLKNAEAELVNHLVEKQIFKPELLNRFDSVIIFQPLLTDDLTRVAKLQLERLVKRLKEQGITLKVDDKIIAVVATSGANQNFGARPMARFIQDHLESAISKKLLTKEIASGATIIFDEHLTVSSVK
ncbi:MAG: AAA family ATPase [Patescibacteria group bacterium]